MSDAAGRSTPRFPPALHAKVDAAIARELDALRHCSSDTAIGSGACVHATAPLQLAPCAVDKRRIGLDRVSS